MSTDRYNMDRNKPILLQGNEAVALGALDAGLGFFGGYPITPSSEIAEILSNEMPKRGRKFIQMEDELASMASIIGASLVGKKAMTATSGPGFSLMQENIGFGMMTEVPCVVVNVQRGGPSTGLPTSPAQGDMMQARWGTHGDHPSITLYPDSVLECYELAIRAFNLAEKYRTPVFLLLDELIGHMREAVKLPPKDELKIINRVNPNVPPEWYKHFKNNPKYISPLASYGQGYRFHVTGLTHDEKGFPTNKQTEIQAKMDKLLKKITDNLDDLIQVEAFHMDDAEVAIFAAGVVARSAKEAVLRSRKKGKKVGLIRPLTIWPFPDKEVERMLESTKATIIAEMNQGQLINEVLRVTKYQKHAKYIELQRYDGSLITPEDILEKINEVL
ncbi:MAG: 2-oxoacid:acceptor oxidoreductase subunit alpha [Candidatus Cloacimonetes bacterium]|nr:2-oxoacid:acceptor oxidoreductase subunit alpha [Candidatus Cloacimonadota bacterium]MBS3767460.1 2-oxoacid:acceptor oxidoreductase subunit alpha [Candidatus Cloacimonadota bacterium]